ncbi:MAG: hypothetical protein AB7F28_06590 [Candidatus Margulisiibacteriota bacterium]
MSVHKIGEGTAESEAAHKLTQNAYYAKLQQGLKEKQQAHQAEKQRESSGHETDTKVDAVAKADKADEAGFYSIKDQVEIRSVKWKKNEKGEPEVDIESGSVYQTSVDRNDDGVRILRLLGHKIDLSSKVMQLKQSFMENTIQARSHHPFLSRYAAFKVGILGQLLAVLGVSAEDITAMQKGAVKAAIQDNISLVGENIYNLELTELVHGKSKKVKHNIAMLKKMQKQLLTQMSHLGRPDYWTPARVVEEQIAQCTKLRDEFAKEQDALAYQLDFLNQGPR